MMRFVSVFTFFTFVLSGLQLWAETTEREQKNQLLKALSQFGQVSASIEIKPETTKMPIASTPPLQEQSPQESPKPQKESEAPVENPTEIYVNAMNQINPQLNIVHEEAKSNIDQIASDADFEAKRRTKCDEALQKIETGKNDLSVSSKPAYIKNSEARNRVIADIDKAVTDMRASCYAYTPQALLDKQIADQQAQLAAQQAAANEAQKPQLISDSQSAFVHFKTAFSDIKRAVFKYARDLDTSVSRGCAFDRHNDFSYQDLNCALDKYLYEQKVDETLAQLADNLKAKVAEAKRLGAKNEEFNFFGGKDQAESTKIANDINGYLQDYLDETFYWSAYRVYLEKTIYRIEKKTWFDYVEAADYAKKNNLKGKIEVNYSLVSRLKPKLKEGYLLDRGFDFRAKEEELGFVD